MCLTSIQIHAYIVDDKKYLHPIASNHILLSFMHNENISLIN